jgi:hypothetical protein
MIILTFFYLFLIGFSDELNNGLGRTPQMGKTYCLYGDVRFFIQGWNSWNHFRCHINETVVRQTADAIVASGLAAAGYQYGQFSLNNIYKSLSSYYHV